ncbi:MAG TPA: prolyl oligopeptidase family serine peptidase, partial [Roseiflexaceae bacterium]|nr:prolyl oligopeptidase family serine peptidase [Roseiflexaceae bacterium]
ISHTDRFKVAVTDRCISNWVSFFGTSDIGYNFTPRELQGALPDDVARLWDMSPLKYARHVKTPTLIIHSEEDHRCPIEQAEQWYIALHRLGVPVRFVRFPGENHELNRAGRPDRRVIRLQEYLAWLEKYL